MYSKIFSFEKLITSYVIDCSLHIHKFLSKLTFFFELDFFIR